MDHSRPSSASAPRLPLHISTLTPASYIPTPAPTAHPPRFSTLFPLQTPQPQPQPQSPPTHTQATTTAATTTTIDQPHSFDDCPACRAEYQAAINASLTTDAQQRQADEQRERDELQNAIRLSQQQPERPHNDDEEELLRRAIEESAREEERRKNWLASSSASSSTAPAPALTDEELLARVLEESARAEEEDRKKRDEQQAWEASILERSRRAAELVEQQRIVESQEASMWRQPAGGSGAGAGSSSHARAKGDVTGRSSSVTGEQGQEEGKAEGKGKEEDYALGLGLRASRGSHELRSEIAQDEDLARAIADEVRSRSERRQQAPAPDPAVLVEEDEEEEEQVKGAGDDPSVDSRLEARSQQPDEEDSFWRKPTDPSKPGPPSTSHPHAHSSSLSSISSSLAGLAQTAAAFNDAEIEEAEGEEGAQTMSLPPVQIAAHLGEFGAGEEGARGGAGGRYGIDVPESVVGSLPPSARTEDSRDDARLSYHALAAPSAEGDDSGGPERSANGSAAAHTDAHAHAHATTIPRPLPVPPGPPPAGSTPMNPNRPGHPAALSAPEVPTSDDSSSLSVPTAVQGAPALTPSAGKAGEANLRLSTEVPTPIDEHHQLLSPSQIDAPTDVESFVDSEAGAEVGEMRRGLSAGTGRTQEEEEEEAQEGGVSSADPPSYTERQPFVGGNGNGNADADGKMGGQSFSHEDGKTSHEDGTSCVHSVANADAGAGALRTSPTSGLGSVASGPSEGIPPSDESSTASTIAPAGGPTTQEGAPPTFVGSVHPLFAGLSYNHNAPAVSSAGGGGLSSPSRDGNGRERSIGHASVSSGLGSNPNPHSNGIGGVMGPVIGSSGGGSGGNAIVQSGAGVVHPPTISSGGGGRWSGEPQIALALRRTSAAAASAANMGSSSSVSSHHTHHSQRGSVSSATGASVSPSAGYGHYQQHTTTTERPTAGRTSFSSSSIISRTSPPISTSASGFTFQQQQQQQQPPTSSSSFNPLFSAFGEEAEDADRTATQRERNTSSFDSATVNTPEKTAGSKTKKKKLKNFFFLRHDRSGSKARDGEDDGSAWTAADRGTANTVAPPPPPPPPPPPGPPGPQGQGQQERQRRGSQPYMNAAASSSQTSLASLGSGSVFSNHAPSFTGNGNGNGHGNGTGTKRRSFGGRSLFGGTSGSSSSSIRGHRAPFWGGGGGGGDNGRPSLDGSGRVEDTVEELQDSVAPGGMI
ncbi:unnamed protein product [Tilletia controversa]|nr:unnamed protein product [Tilletia controversa]